MKLSDLKRVSEIDSNIQSLLGELSALYQTREHLFKTQAVKSPRKRKTNALDQLDFSSFDLTLTD